MTLFKNKYRAETTRLKNWDYSSQGYYFITICTKNKTNYFGKIKNSRMIYSSIGDVAKNMWQAIPDHNKNVVMDEFQIMPNHVHGIIVIVKSSRDEIADTRHGVYQHHGVYQPSNKTLQLSHKNKNKFSKPIPGSVPVIINQYKSSIKRWCNKNNYSFFNWQDKYYDHIIKNEYSLMRIRRYIKNNPLNWKTDKFR